MKKIFLFPILIGTVLLNSCNNDRLIVDVSDINVDFTALWFDKEFLPIDTTNSAQTISELKSKFGNFANFFLDTILQEGGVKNPRILQTLANDPFYPAVMEVQEGINVMEPDVKTELNLLEDGFRHLKYYFPNSNTPIIVLYNSWFQYGTLSYQNYLGIGLDFFVPDTAIQRIYPPQFYNYLKQDMRPELIASSAMYAHIANVVYPSQGNENSLLDNMIVKGKQRYLLEAMLPEMQEHLIMNYTPEELEWCYKKELAVWRELSKVQEDNTTTLFTVKKADINRWTQPGPFTAALSEEATDRMGEWIGLQMIRDYMRQNLDVSPVEMLDKSSSEIMKHYNPKK